MPVLILTGDLHLRRLLGRRRRPPSPAGRRNSEGCSYFPVNLGVRFSTLAARPSLASLDLKSSDWSSRSSASADSMGSSEPVWTDRLMWPTAIAALAGEQNCRA